MAILAAVAAFGIISLILRSATERNQQDFPGKILRLVPLIEVREHCIESGQIGVSKNVGAVRKTHQSLTAAACR